MFPVTASVILLSCISIPRGTVMLPPCTDVSLSACVVTFTGTSTSSLEPSW